MPTPDEIALAHAKERWAAELDHARRLNARRNGILTVVSAVLGLGIFKLGALADIQPPWLLTLLRVQLGASAILFLISLWLLLRGGRDGENVSLALRWPRDARFRPHALATERDARSIAFARLRAASERQYDKNDADSITLANGQAFFLLAATVATIALISYIALAEPVSTDQSTLGAKPALPK